MKVQFCPPLDSPLINFGGVIGEVEEPIREDRLTFRFHMDGKQPWKSYTGIISCEWDHVEVLE